MEEGGLEVVGEGLGWVVDGLLGGRVFRLGLVWGRLGRSGPWVRLGGAEDGVKRGEMIFGHMSRHFNGLQSPDFESVWG